MKINKNEIKKVCIDDFAIKRRHKYGTVMIDIETHAIIDMIESREYNDVVNWLRDYPNIEIFSRDGSITYNSAINTSHPNEIQVSDRFHILKNLTSYCKDYLSKYLNNRITIELSTVVILKTKEELSKSQKNKTLSRKEKLIKAQELYKNGISKSKICDSLNLDIRTLNKMLEENQSDLQTTRDIIYNENIAKKQHMIDEVRALFNNGSKISQISSELSIDRRTVKKYLDIKVSAVTLSYRSKRTSKLTPYIHIVDNYVSKGFTYTKIQ